MNGRSQNRIIITPVHIMEVPCVQGRELIEGVFSGHFYVDDEGSWNGTTFTITVNDTNPHFFYWISYRYWGSPCSIYANWSDMVQFSPDQDVLFALNPVTSSQSLLNFAH